MFLLEKKRFYLYLNQVYSLDPGIRTFATVFGSDGKIFEFGKGDCGRFHKIALSIDKLQSKCDQKSTNHKRRYSYKKAIRRLQIKIQNLRKDLHHKLSKFLCENYQIILLPEFNSQNIVKKFKRKIQLFKYEELQVYER